MDILLYQDDGTLVVWDLREPSSMHKTNNTSGDFNKLYRIPTFTTGMWFECNYVYNMYCSGYVMIVPIF